MSSYQQIICCVSFCLMCINILHITSFILFELCDIGWTIWGHTPTNDQTSFCLQQPSYFAPKSMFLPETMQLWNERLVWHYNYERTCQVSISTELQMTIFAYIVNVGWENLAVRLQNASGEIWRTSKITKKTPTIMNNKGEYITWKCNNYMEKCK